MEPMEPPLDPPLVLLDLTHNAVKGILWELRAILFPHFKGKVSKIVGQISCRRLYQWRNCYYMIRLHHSFQMPMQYLLSASVIAGIALAVGITLSYTGTLDVVTANSKLHQVLFIDGF